jgi:hypothetical protein
VTRCPPEGLRRLGHSRGPGGRSARTS